MSTAFCRGAVTKRAKLLLNRTSHDADTRSVLDFLHSTLPVTVAPVRPSPETSRPGLVEGASGPRFLARRDIPGTSGWFSGAAKFKKQE